jgi:hypothetical protein
MDTVLKCLNFEIPLSLHRARVVHANKYSEAFGGAFDFPVSSTLYTDVVFRLHENNEDYKTYIRNLDLPIYTDQDVTIICSGKRVLGYIDMQTNYYYYTVNNFSRELGLRLPSLWVWIVAVLAGIAIYFTSNDEGFLWLLLLLIAVYFFHLMRRWYVNHRIRRAIDAVLS